VTGALLLAATKVVTATSSPSPSGFSPSIVSPRATDDNVVRPGWLGFIVFLAMAGALYLVLKSFVRHLKRVNFDEGPDPAGVRPVPTEPRSVASDDDAVDRPGPGGDAQV
jgi:hypothetical protein